MNSTESNTSPSEMEAETLSKEERSQRTRKGIFIIPIGAITLLLSCVTTLLMPDTFGLFNYILYGLTSIGAIVVFYGLYLVME